MNRLWVVEAKFYDGTWGICNFGLGAFASTNYHAAHKMKRKQQRYLQEHGNPKWYKKCFRVKEYKAL